MSFTSTQETLGQHTLEDNMALAASNLTSGVSNTDASSYDTASVSPTANALVLLSVSTRRNAATPAQPTASGCGLTWVVEKTQLSYSAGTPNRRLTIFRAMGSSPSTGVITISCTDTQTEAAWSVDQITGTDTSGTNGSGAIVQSGSNNDGGVTATSCTITLSAFSSANNMAYGAKTHTDATATTPGTGFTELAEQTSAENGTGFETEYKVNDNTVDWSWTGSNSWFAAALEIKQATTSIKTINGLAVASVKTVNGLAIASVKTVNGLA